MSLVVSGGQSGVDRAALDAAIALRIPYGGWCPAGGAAEDFPDPPGLLADYPELEATPSAGPAQRTEWNVRDSDATLVVRPTDAHSPGTLLTEVVAGRLGRPWLRVDPSDKAAPAVARAFIEVECAGGRLNLAGPRESESPGIYVAASRLFEDALGPELPG